jgi:hypothetical protein
MRASASFFTTFFGMPMPVPVMTELMEARSLPRSGDHGRVAMTRGGAHGLIGVRGPSPA